MPTWNPGTLAATVTERAPGLVLYARQWLDAASAEDVVQEALVALLAQRVVPEDPLAWVCRAVRNAAIDQVRTAGRRRRRERAVAESRPERWFGAAAAETLLDARAAQEAMAGLSDGSREVLVLRIWADLSFPQIAAALGLSVSTVHNRYTGALDQVRTLMERSSCQTNRS